MHHSDRVSTFLIAAMELGSLFMPDTNKYLKNKECIDIQPVSLLFQQGNACL